MNMRHTRPAGFLILVASASLAAAQDNMRFRGMDRNNDGKIARAEWHGSDRSFRNHDWNGDGVLSGDEVRVTGHRPMRSGDWDLDGIIDREEELTAERFRNLDHNGDGRLSSDEWHADLASFRRLDRDRNGLLGPLFRVGRHVLRAARVGGIRRATIVCPSERGRTRSKS